MSARSRLYLPTEVPVVDDRQLMARTATVIWVTIAFFGFLASLDFFRAGGQDVSAMRAFSVSAALITLVVILVPWERIPRTWFSPLLALMSLHIGALAYAGGGGRGDLAMLFMFVVVFVAYFLSWRETAGHLGLIALLLAASLFVIDKPGAPRIEAIRLAILFPAFVIVSGLVSILRNSGSERERKLKQLLRMHDPLTGLMTTEGLSRLLYGEVSRAVRHVRPLSLVLLEVSGATLMEEDAGNRSRLARAIARALISRLRPEDTAARLGELRFGVVAAETAGDSAAALGAGLVDQVRKRLITLGYETGSFSIGVGWADYPHDGQSSQELLDAAERALARDKYAITKGSRAAAERALQSPPGPLLRSP